MPGHLQGNRHERRAKLVEQRQFVAQLPERLTPIPADEIPTFPQYLDTPPIAMWRSRYYLVQLYDEATEEYPTLHRLSICRSLLGPDGRWVDGLSWDELQALKSAVGYGAWYGIEVYPANRDIVNVANYRHLWIMQEPLNIGWKANKGV